MATDKIKSLYQEHRQNNIDFLFKNLDESVHDLKNAQGSSRGYKLKHIEEQIKSIFEYKIYHQSALNKNFVCHLAIFTPWLLSKAVEEKIDLSGLDYFSRSPLSYVCSLEDPSFAKSHYKDSILSLLKLGANPNQKDGGERGHVPLMHLFLNQKFDVLEKWEIFQEFLKYKANLNTQDAMGFHLISYMIKDKGFLKKFLTDEPELAQPLLKALDNKTGASLLFHLVQNKDDFSIVLLNDLVGFGLDVNHQEYSGTTALMVACESNNEKMVIRLLELGADCLLKNSSGYNALNSSPQMKKVIEQWMINQDILQKNLNSETVKPKIL